MSWVRKGIRVAGKRRAVVELLLRREDPAVLLGFFQALSEGLAVSFADSAKAFPGRGRPTIFARGAIRRALMDRAFQEAASRAGISVTTGITDPPTWSYPVARMGAFSVSLGVVDRTSCRGARRLRSRGVYVRDLVSRNAPLNPQASLFEEEDGDMPIFIPKGAFGALVVVESSTRVPDSPVFMGLMVPAPSLRGSYYLCSLEYLVRTLRERVAETKVPARRVLQRKKPRLKTKPPKPAQG